jgi:hypothetical protein
MSSRRKLHEGGTAPNRLIDISSPKLVSRGS